MIRLKLEKLRRHSRKTCFPKIGLIPIQKSTRRRSEKKVIPTYVTLFFNAYEKYEFIFL